MNRPLLLDLFCKAGGASMGYHRAGFQVVGVDVQPQPRYPFEFYQADVLDLGPSHFAGFDVVHASPPCQHYANVTRWTGKQEEHPALIAPTRKLLQNIGLPYVIENVRQFELRQPTMLCGSWFGLRVMRHRYFEASFALPFQLNVCDHRDCLPFMHKGEHAYADAMGCSWMNKTEARESIPPAYTEWIGAQLLRHLERAA